MPDPDAPIPNDTIEAAWNGILKASDRFENDDATRSFARLGFYLGSYMTLMRVKDSLATGDMAQVMEQIAETEAEFAEFKQHNTPH